MRRRVISIGIAVVVNKARAGATSTNMSKRLQRGIDFANGNRRSNFTLAFSTRFSCHPRGLELKRLAVDV